MTKKIAKLIWPAICIILVFAYFHTCHTKNKEVKEYKENIAFANKMLNDNQSTWRRDSSLMGEEIAVQKALFLNEKEAKDLALIENQRLKKVKSEVKVVTKTKIEQIYIPVHDTFTVVKGDTRRSRNFGIDQKWYALHGKVLPDQVLIDSMMSKSEVVVTTGYEKQKGLFKKSILVVDVKDKNPHSQITGLYNVQVPKRKKKWFETKGAAIGLGGLVGMYLGIKL